MGEVSVPTLYITYNKGSCPTALTRIFASPKLLLCWNRYIKYKTGARDNFHYLDFGNHSIFNYYDWSFIDISIYKIIYFLKSLYFFTNSKNSLGVMIVIGRFACLIASV